MDSALAPAPHAACSNLGGRRHLLSFEACNRNVFAEWSEKRDREAKHGREVHHTVQYSTSRMRQFGHFTDAGGAAPGKLGSASGHTACVCAQLCDDWLLHGT